VCVIGVVRNTLSHYACILNAPVRIIAEICFYKAITVWYCRKQACLMTNAGIIVRCGSWIIFLRTDAKCHRLFDHFVWYVLYPIYRRCRL